MKIKFKNSLRDERNTICFLIAVSIISFLMSVFLEYILPVLISEEIYGRLHGGFLTNLALGISGSSIVSFLAIVFPFVDKKNKQYNYINEKLKNVYNEYSVLYSYIILKSESDKEQSDFDISEGIKNVQDSINVLITEYGSLDIKLESIDKIISILTNNIQIILGMLETWVEYLQVLSECSKIYTRQEQIQREEYINKCAEKDWYSYIVKEIDGVYPFNTFAGLFVPFFDIKQVVNNNIVSCLEDINHQIKTNQRRGVMFSYSVKMRKEFQDIRTEHSNKYYEEYDAIKEEFYNALKVAMKQGNKNIELNKWYEKIESLLSVGNFQEAKNLIKEIK